MEIRRRRGRSFSSTCRCSRSLPIFSSFVFLAAILPRSSFAQLTNSLSLSTTPPPTTLQTSTSSSLRPSSSNPSPTNAQAFTPAQSTSSSTTTDDDGVSKHAFNYYFLMVVVVVVLFCLCILYIGQRKKRKAAIMRGNSQRALARDVEGLRGRFGIRRPGFTSSNTGRGEERLEGLDDRGEAPPPYMPRSKPASLRDTDEISPPSIDSGVGFAAEPGEATELRRISTGVESPPGYNENVNETAEGDVGIARPYGAVTVGDEESDLPRPYTALMASDGYSGVSRPDTALTIAGSTRRLLHSSSGSGRGTL